MKQVIFAIAMLAMASLTGCLTDDESSVDETTDTTSDNTGNTNDNSDGNSDTNQDNTDTGDDGLIDPVGTDGGVTIPEDSSIFMDSNGQPGKWNCIGVDADKVCNFEYYANDYFESGYNNDGEISYIVYRDSDGIQNSIDFNGWVNKTGNSVTIEGLKYPDRGPTVSGSYGNSDDGNYYIYYYTNAPVSGTCNSGSECQIIFYGHNGLTYNGWFTLSDKYSWNYQEDTDGDGTADNYHQKTVYTHHSVVFDLPFEPYAFSILSGYDLEQQYRSVDRIF